MKKFIALLSLLCLLLCGCEYSIVLETQPANAPADAGRELLIHFLDVGQADCALIECDGEFLLIDGGNREDGQLVVSYLQQQGVEVLNTVICTHAHEDHVGGLPSVLAVYPTQTVLSPTKTYSSNIFDKFLYYVDQQGLEVEIPSPGDVLNVGSATVTVLGPVKSYADPNNTSIVCRIDYGKTSFLFTGDMEQEAEGDMLDYWGSKVNWEVDLLKVGHHGSNTSSGYRFLNELNATYGVISVGKGNDYGHPHEEPLSRFRQAGITILRTDEMGTVLAVSDGSQITLTWENQSADPENAEQEAFLFIGNKNSKVFHAENCSSLPSEKNRVEFASYDAAIAAGFTPCKGCLK